MTATASQTQIQRAGNAGVPAINYTPNQLAELETIAQQYSLANTSTLGRFQAAFTLAAGLRRLWDSISDDMMQDILTLAGTSLGFKTDRDSGDKPKYPVDVVRECFIEATLRGARPIGNEFNIISGRCYLTKEFYMRALGEVPGVTNVTVATGIPGALGDGLCGVRVSLRWLRHGDPEELASADEKKGRVFAVKYFGKLEADQVIGKALRKAYKAAYEQVTGSSLVDDDDAIVDGEAVGVSRPAGQPAQPTRTAALAQRVGARALPPAVEPDQDATAPEPAELAVEEDEKPAPRVISADEFPQIMAGIAQGRGVSPSELTALLGKVKLNNAIAKQAVRTAVVEAFAAGKLGDDGKIVE